MFGVPFQYTLSKWVLWSTVLCYCCLWSYILYDVTDESIVCRILLARLEYLRDTFQIKEGDFLTFDALVWFYNSIALVSKEQLLFWLSGIRNYFSCERLRILLLFFWTETSCSMCGPSDPVKGWLWDDDLCWQKVCIFILPVNQIIFLNSYIHCLSHELLL